MTKTELAKEYVEKYLEIAIREKRQASKRFIATVLFTENPKEFKDVEDARLFVRRATNSHGNTKRFLKYEDLAKRFALIPEAVFETRTTEPFIVPTTIKKTLWMADVHGRFYNKEATEIAIEYGVRKGCDSVIILGDFMDFYQHSKFDKNPLIARDIEIEQEWGQETLQLLQDAFGTVALKEGNHDARREMHIARLSATMPELMQMANYSDYLFFDGCRVNFVEDYRHIVYGKLAAFHGHEYYGGGGIHVAYNRFNKALDNIITAHSHKAQSLIKTNIHGHIYGSWCLGCLCQLSPRYSPKNDWNNGFAVTEKNADGDFEVDNRVIYGNKTFSV